MRFNMKLGTKLIVCMSVVVGLALVLGVAACLTVRGLGDSTNSIVNVTARKRTLVGELNTTANALLAQERGIVLGSILQQVAAMQQSKEHVQEALSTSESLFRMLDPVAESDEERAVFARLAEDFRAVRRAHDELLQYIDRQQFDQVQKVADERVLPKLKLIMASCERLVQTQNDRLAGAAKDASFKASASWWLMIVLITLATGASLPIIVVIRNINKKLRYIAGQMNEGSGQVANAAGEVSTSSQALAQNAAEQAASLEETAASSEEITSMTQKNAENSRQVAELMAQVDACIGEANRTLAEMIGSMRDINSSSDRISKIIKVIDEIAFQTNILALNAAVEAARAGEAGMGFAVVADEVRNLAQRCAQAAKDTADLIEESISKSSGGSAKLGQMESAIQAITQSATKVRTLVDEVSLGSQEQSRGIQHIAKAISRMEGMTQKTAASAEESASAAEELSAQSRTMETVVRELRQMVDGTDALRLEDAGPERRQSRPQRVRPATPERVDETPRLVAAAIPKKKVNGHAAAHIPPPSTIPLDESFTEF